MTRDITSAMQTAVALPTIRPVVMVYLDLPSGAIRVNSSPYSITYAGFPWAGVGSFGGISAVEEILDFGGPNLDLTLSGIDNSLVSVVFTDHYQGRTAQVFLGLLTEAHTVITDPVEVFTGRIDYMSVDTGETSTIGVRLENELVDWERPRIRRYNNEDQQSAYPLDVAFEYIEQMVNTEIRWGY